MSEQATPVAEKAAEPPEKDRADRREEIKLWLDYARSAVAVVGLVGVALAVLQWQNSNITARDNALTAKQTAYARIAGEWRDHVRLLVDNPDLRPYFADGRALDAGDDKRNPVLALADHRLEVMDSILHYARIAGQTDEIGGWISTFERAFRSSPVLCRRAVEVRQDYGTDLQGTISRACGQ